MDVHFISSPRYKYIEKNKTIIQQTFLCLIDFILMSGPNDNPITLFTDTNKKLLKMALFFIVQ